MKAVLVLVLCSLTYLEILKTQCASVLPKSVEDYYWRDYLGLLPSNAIPGGTNKNGETLYLAQFTTTAEYHIEAARLHTIPAIIKAGSKYAVGAYAGRVIRSNETTNTKILCYGSSLSRYRWYSPAAAFPPNCRFVVGGVEDAIPMYIGRAKVDKELIVGKIFSDNALHREVLISPYNEHEAYYNTYEVLTYCS